MISKEIDMKLLNEAILRSNNLIDTIIGDVKSEIVPESFYEHLQHDIEKNLPNKFPVEIRYGESKLLSYQNIADQIINIDKLCETYDFSKYMTKIQTH